MKRKRKQKKKYLGKRTFGKGDVKNQRGAGNRGGRGNAGRNKHKFTWVTKYAPGYFGRDRFTHISRRRIPVLHLYEIQQQATNGTLKPKEGKYSIEFKGKVLSTGRLSVAVTIKALAWSKRCEEKVKNAGGTLEKIGA